MTYSMKTYPPLEGEFPPPPEWLVWQGGASGQIRHHDTLQKAKRSIYVNTYGGANKFWYNWRIYRWDHDDQKYTLEYSGQKDEPKADNPLYKKRIARQDLTRVVPEEDVDAAIESIMSTSRGG